MQQLSSLPHTNASYCHIFVKFCVQIYKQLSGSELLLGVLNYVMIHQDRVKSFWKAMPYVKGKQKIKYLKFLLCFGFNCSILSFVKALFSLCR